MDNSATSAQELADAITIVATGPKGTSRAFFNATVQLQSLHTHQVIQRCFSESAEAVYALSAILPALTTTENVEAAQNEIFGRVDAAEKDIGNEIQRVAKLIESSGIDINQLGYTAAQTFHAQICSPRANQLLRVIKQLDDLIKLLDTLWLTETITQKVHTETVFLWKRRVIKLMNHVREVGFRAMNAAHRANAKAGKNEADLSATTAEVQDTKPKSKAVKPARKTPAKETPAVASAA